MFKNMLNFYFLYPKLSYFLCIKGSRKPVFNYGILAWRRYDDITYEKRYSL